MAGEPLLEVENLRTTFETDRGKLTAVDGISFDIQPGEIFGVVGESGSGKSVTALSLMRLVEGTVQADAIQYKGEDLLSKTDREMRDTRGGEIAMIFQDPMSSLNPVMTVGEQIAEVVRHHDDIGESRNFTSELRRKYVTGTLKSSASWRRAVELLELAGIPDPEQRAEDHPHQLSGGMQQRVMIAQALAGDPSLIIADEPTTALDVSIEAQILNQLLDLRDEFEVSIMLITHDLGVIRETCDRVTVMYAGELMEEAPTHKLFEQPRHPYTNALMQSVPRISVKQEELESIPGTVPDLIDKPSGCPFRNRCEKAFERCDQALIGYEVGVEHTAHCHLYHPDVQEQAGPAEELSVVRPSESPSVSREEE